MNKKTIFISYGRDENHPEDVELIKRIKSDLENEFNLLMDIDRLKGPDDWENKLSDDLDASDWVVFFITPFSARRPNGYCLNEIAYALWKKKNIAPVMLTQEVPPLSICRLQYLDIQDLKKGEGKYQEKISKLVEVLKEEKKLGFEGEHLKVLDDLNPIKFETILSKHSYDFVGREWVYDEIDRWLADKGNSRVLWITAEAGFGKSAIAAYLARTHPSAMSVYFCQYDYVESKDPREMLKVLIYELSTQIDGYQKILQTLDIKGTLLKSPEHIFTQLLLEPLQQIDKPKEKHFFIIDALDEASSDGKNKIVELISNRFLDLPSWFNIVITSRPEPELVRKLKKFNSIELIADDERNKNDLEQFLRDRKSISNGNLTKALISKSEGNILYLKSIFELEMIRKGELTLENIERLPDSMEGFFLRYFERKFEDIELYEEKYLIFVSLLMAYRDGIPELLIRDILKLSQREYNKIKGRFGSLLEINNNSLIFYHKSIYEWLSDYDKSGDYSADLEEGQRILDEFIDSMNNETYTKNYIEFYYFNKRLIDKIYKQDKSLERFFGLLKFVADEKIIKQLAKLSHHYFFHNKMYRAVELQERLYVVTKNLYQDNSDRWAEDYTTVLNNLALSYVDLERHSEAITLQEESLKIRKELYSQNPDRWVEDYTIALNNLASCYLKNNKISEAIELWEENIKILKELYQDNPERWTDKYTIVFKNFLNMYNKIDSKDRAKKLKRDHKSIFTLQINAKIFKPQPVALKIGRNDPCPCNSGKKYKKCCGKNR